MSKRIFPQPPPPIRTELLVGDQPYVQFMAENGYMGKMWTAPAPEDMETAKRKINLAFEMVKTDKAINRDETTNTSNTGDI
jgi:hypothetical protein